MINCSELACVGHFIIYSSLKVGIFSQQELACVVDCIDCAADSAVVAAVLEGVAAAQHLARHLDAAEMFKCGRPWIMVSINDDEDPHFRKAGELLQSFVMNRKD